MKLKTVFIVIITCVLAGAVPVPASNNDTLSKGIDAFDAGRWTPAADLLKKAASQEPGDEVVRLTAGVALANVKRYPEAAEQFEWAVRIAPEGVVPLMLLDGTYSELGNTSEARQARNKANGIISAGRAFRTVQSSDKALADSLEKYPRNAIAFCLLGDSYQLEGKLDLAKQQYAKSAGLAPLWAKPVFNLGLANLQTDAKTAEVNFQQTIELDPTNNRAYLWLGDAYLKQQQPAKAIDAYTKAQQDKSLVAESQTRIGNAQMQAGKYADAQQWFATAASNAPKDPRPVAGQAQVFQNNGQYKEAESKYNEAGDILSKNGSPASSQAVLSKQVAQVQSAQGRVQDADQNYMLAYDLQSNFSNAITLAQARKQAGKLPESIASSEAALKKNPSDVQAMTYLLAAYKIEGNAQGRFDMAMKLVTADPTNAGKYRAELGCAQMALGYQTAALDSFAEALDAGDAATWEDTARSAKECGALEKITERYDQVYSLSKKMRVGKVLFELYSAMGNAPQMVATAEKLSKQTPDDASILLRLGQAYERANRTSDAMAVYTKLAANQDAAAASAARARIEALNKP